MWYVRGFMFLLMLFLLAYVFITNSGQAVDLNFFGHSYLDISVYWVVVVSFLMGFLTSFGMASIREFRLRRLVGRLRKEAKAKDREISDLRTLPLGDDQNPAEAKTASGSADA